MFTKAKYLGLAAGVLLIGVCASAQTVIGWSPFVLIPAVGVAPTESVQVNVTNMAPFPPNGGSEPNCSGIILFYYSPANSPNSVLPFAQTGFSVASGQSFSFSAAYSSTGGTGERQVIRPAINLAITTSGTTPACILVSSVETFDTSSGVVHAVINPPAVTQGVDSRPSRNRQPANDQRERLTVPPMEIPPTGIRPPLDTPGCHFRTLTHFDDWAPLDSCRER